MDNKELSLEEIIANNSAEREGSVEADEKSAEQEVLSELGDDLVQGHKLTVDEILAESTSHESGSDGAEESSRRSVMTLDEILAEVSSDENDKDIDKTGDEELSHYLDEPEEAASEPDETEQTDKALEYDDEIDNEPTVIMPKRRNTASSRPRNDGRRRSSGEIHKKQKHKQKQSKFNGTIFGGIILTCIIITVSIVLSVTALSIATEYYGIGKSDNDVIFNIPAGSTNQNIADLLYENGIINNKSLFLIALKIEKPETIFPGDITLQASMGYPDVIEKLATQREKKETVNVTITEGMNLLEVANLLEKNKVCKAEDFLFEFNKDQGFEFERNLNINKDAFYKMEGYFFPETYNFYVDDTAYNVTKIVREQFQSVLNADIMRQIEANKFTLNQIMTLASIVQMESASEKEMPKVASVFINRLNEPDIYPNLQSDTTTKYINSVINKKAIDATSAEYYAGLYDTYKCSGLPASPICNPGLAAIKAVLNPEKTDYYFFCNNLATGETFYARTNEEHNANLKKAGLI